MEIHTSSAIHPIEYISHDAVSCGPPTPGSLLTSSIENNSGAAQRTAPPRTEDGYAPPRGSDTSLKSSIITDNPKSEMHACKRSLIKTFA